MRWTLGNAIGDEIAKLRNDRWLLTIVIWLPLLLSMLLVAIFSAAVPRELPVGVVDLDRSSLSRKFIRYLDASPALQVADQFESQRDGKVAIGDGDLYALVVIPAHLARDAALGKAPEITAFFNAQYLLVAKAIRSTLYEIEANIATELDVARTIVETPVLSAALAESLPIRSQITSLYNMNLNYAQFLIPGIVAALLQILICSTTILSLGREFKWGGSHYWKNYDLGTAIVGKMIVYTVLFVAHGMLLLGVFFAVLGWPYHANLAMLVPVLTLFVIACQILGAFFFVLSFDMTRALSFAGAFSAPAFAFLGVTFPASDMSVFAHFWRDLMPAAHFIDAFIVRTSYAGSFGDLVLPSLILCGSALLVPWVAGRLKQKIVAVDDFVPAAT
jgi:ABC-2 type transport system permease protein